MLSTATVFDRPQCHLLPDLQGPRMYANVSNVVEVARSVHSVFRVAIAVPTDLFTIMRDVLRVPLGCRCSLAIDYVESVFVLSLLVEGETEALHDLWTYPSRGLPAWMLDSSYHL